MEKFQLHSILELYLNQGLPSQFNVISCLLFKLFSKVEKCPQLQVQKKLLLPLLAGLVDQKKHHYGQAHEIKMRNKKKGNFNSLKRLNFIF